MKNKHGQSGPRFVQTIPYKGARSCQGLTCKGGTCCPIKGWVCCHAQNYCAMKVNDCPKVPNQDFASNNNNVHGRSLMITRSIHNRCEGRMCPGGACCPIRSWICCQAPNYCAMKVNDCPSLPNREPEFTSHEIIF